MSATATVGGTGRPAPFDAPTKALLTVGAFAALLVGSDTLVVSPLIPSIAADTHTSAHSGGLLVTAYALVYAVVGPLFGPVSDRWGRKPTALAGLVVFSVSTALTGVGSSFALTLAFRALAGLGAAMLLPSVFAAVSDRVPPERRGSAIGVITGMLMGSSVIGVPAGALVAQAASWRWCFFGIGALGAAALVWAALRFPGGRPPRQLPGGPVKVYIGQFKAALSMKPVLFVLGSTMFWSAGLQGMFANVGEFYRSAYSLSTGRTGLAMLLAGACSVLGNLYGGRTADRYGRRLVIAVAGVAAALAVVAFSLTTGSLVAAIVVQGLWGAAIGFGQASLTTLVSELSPRARGTALSLNASSQYVGVMVGTAAAAALLSAGAGFFVIGALCALCTLIVVPLVLVSRPRTADAAEPGAVGASSTAPAPSPEGKVS
ncbi:MFS transporter [Streptomyces anandii]|uniref:MFS transporter n=1 Tax=Streptomyces anandii TaxID=285454 RepID=UPI0016743192|nr:MFS transporter [Streptomyces anandii]GGX81576.1 multidrug resistance protein [Streptomyces anandii JCM 4720]